MKSTTIFAIFLHFPMTEDIFSKCFRSQPLPGFGFELVQNVGCTDSLLNIATTRDLYSTLAHSGAMIYRGFSFSLDEFDEFVGKHSSRVTLDPARKSSTANTAEIDAGDCEMGLHRENGSLPFAPDLQWFFCLEAAKRGSETTICDGTRVLFELPGEVRRLFEQRKIRFSRRILWSKVQRYLSVELQVPLETVDTLHLETVNGQVPGQRFSRIEPHLVQTELITSAITTSKFSGKLAFCNSLLGPSVNYEPPAITWDTGEDIEFEVWDAVKDATSRCTYDLFWNRGDIVVLDNTRVMHGRRRLLDRCRRIFGAQSYRKELAS